MVRHLQNARLDVLLQVGLYGSLEATSFHMLYLQLHDEIQSWAPSPIYAKYTYVP